MNTAPLLLKSAALGIASSMVALLVAFFASSDGVRANMEAWPPAAKAIVKERPGEPISTEQWRRIEKALREHGGDAMPSHTAAAELRKAWPTLAIVALFALGLARWRWRALTLGAAVLVLAPTAFLLLGAFTHTHAYLP
jgi:hypothetical protein